MSSGRAGEQNEEIIAYFFISIRQYEIVLASVNGPF